MNEDVKLKLEIIFDAIDEAYELECSKDFEMYATDLMGQQSLLGYQLKSCVHKINHSKYGIMVEFLEESNSSNGWGYDVYLIKITDTALYQKAREFFKENGKADESPEGFKSTKGNDLDDNIFHDLPLIPSKPTLLFKKLANGNYENREKLSPTVSWLIDYLFKNRCDKEKREFHPREISKLCKLGKSAGGVANPRTLQTAISKINGLCEKYGITKIFTSTSKNGFHSLNPMLGCMVKLNSSSKSSLMSR